jgi:uncharacterized Rmd1/YagE family protein
MYSCCCCALQVKLAISHALAQSTLLGCYEERLQVRAWIKML